MPINPWIKKYEETAFEAYGRALKKRAFLLPDQHESDYYVLQTANPVCILALTPDQKVILAKQFRPGPEAVLLELPGGGIEPGEAPEQAAARELLEETGYRGALEFVTRCLDCGYNTVDRYCCVATNCERASDPKNDATEWTETVLVPLEEFRRHLRSGRLTDVEVAYLGLDHLGLL